MCAAPSSGKTPLGGEGTAIYLSVPEAGDTGTGDPTLPRGSDKIKIAEWKGRQWEMTASKEDLDEHYEHALAGLSDEAKATLKSQMITHDTLTAAFAEGRAREPAGAELKPQAKKGLKGHEKSRKAQHRGEDAGARGRSAAVHGQGQGQGQEEEEEEERRRLGRAPREPAPARFVGGLSAFQAREGSTAAINTYDNQIVAWGTGWGGLGWLGKVMERATASDAVREALGAAGVRSARLPLLGILLPDALQEVLYREGTAALFQGLKRGVADHVHDRAPASSCSRAIFSRSTEPSSLALGEKPCRHTRTRSSARGIGK